jgi:D-sedoheptulose 7-phosphate isomerase
MRDKIKKELEASAKTIEGLPTGDIVKAADLITASLRAGNKILLCGNGGSAADCQHIAAEFVGRFKRERDAFRAVALTTDTSVLTALANDYGAEVIFSRQVAALGREGDILLAFSTSGTSQNILKAVESAREAGIKVIGFTGAKGSRLKNMCDVCITVASDDTPRIQEAHITAAHIICGIVEDSLS